MSMKQMQHKSNRIQNIQDETQTPPSNQAIRLANTNFLLQISKSRSIKGFGENIGQLSLYVYVSHLNISLLYMVSQEVSHLKVNHFFLWKTGFLATEVALVLSHMRGTPSKITPKSLMVCTFHWIWE
jgi:hypothetical protein